MPNALAKMLSLLPVVALALGAGQPTRAQDAGRVAFVVELEIVPTELESFKIAVKENAAARVREEPGCLEFNIALQRQSNPRIHI